MNFRLVSNLLDALNDLETEGNAIVTHAWNKLEISSEDLMTPSVFLVFKADKELWTLVEGS